MNFKTRWFIKGGFFPFFVALFCIGFAILLCVEAWYSRAREINLAEQYLEAYVQVLERHALASIEKIDIVLRTVQTGYEGWRQNELGEKYVALRLNAMLDTIPEAQNLYIVDSGGRFIFDTADDLSDKNIADRTYFQANMMDRSGRLIISEPVLNRLTNNWTITLSRRLDVENGAFAGLVLATVSNRYFEEFYSHTVLGKGGKISIFDDQMRLLGRFPHAPDLIGTSFQGFRANALLQNGQESGTYRYHPSGDGGERLVAFRKVENYPLVVMASTTIESVLEQWNRKAVFFFVNLILLTLLLFFLTMSWMKNYRLFLKEAHYKEYYYELTGLPKVKMLREHFSKTMENGEPVPGKTAVLVLDIANFKHVNESLGRPSGDYLLRMISRRFSGLISIPNVVSRHGGDEFVFFLPAFGDINAISRFAESLLETITTPLALDGQDITLGASVGISIYPEDGDDLDTLLKSAEAAMYHAKVKTKHRTSYQFFSADMNEQLAHRVRMETALRKALYQHELSLHYQPQFSMEKRRLIGFEALARWYRPEKGFVSPDHFIPAAESANLIIPLGEWILREACRQRKEWLDNGIDDVTMAVNLSAVQFRDPGLRQLILDTLAATKLPPRYLELEITETAAMENTEMVVALLEGLREIGVKISIDDFGTGYSSLSYLQRFPINKIKIDRSFVRDIVTNQDSAAIVEAILLMGRRLDLICIAEGVETLEQVDILHSYGCHEIQGYLSGRPVPANEATDRLLSGRWSARAPSW